MKEVIIQKNEHGNIRSSLEYFLKFNVNKKAKILDIGANYGSLIFNIFNNGYKYIEGVEINKKAVAKGKKAYPGISKKIKHYNGKKLPYKNNIFDVVIMFDVIEHIPDIEKFLRSEVYRVLKKRGIFIFQTPNRYINIPWEIINQRSLTKWKEYHCSLQTKNSLKKILENSKFKNIVIEKGDILTNHNKMKVKKKLPFIGTIMLYFLSILPTKLNPNFWGSARK